MPRNLPQRRSNSTKLPNKRPSSRRCLRRSFFLLAARCLADHHPVGNASKFIRQLCCADLNFMEMGTHRMRTALCILIVATWLGGLFNVSSLCREQTESL